VRHNRLLVGQPNELVAVPRPKPHKQYHWPTVENAALARTIRGIFPALQGENRQAIHALERRFATQFKAEVKKEEGA
jgi:hypothetical protein